MRQAVILHRQKIVFVGTQKVASTSIMTFLYRLAGVPLGSGNHRRLARRKGFGEQLRSAGAELRTLYDGDLASLKAETDAYLWVAAKRDPTDRFVSAYCSKVHRYAQVFEPNLYRRAAITRIRYGLKAVGDSRYLAAEVGRYLDINEVVPGLKEHGTEFDSHFQRQTSILGMPEISYDFVVRQEQLAADLKELCRKSGADHTDLEVVPRQNRTLDWMRENAQLTVDSLRLLGELYAPDYELLSYPVPWG